MDSLDNYSFTVSFNNLKGQIINLPIFTDSIAIHEDNFINIHFNKTKCTKDEVKNYTKTINKTDDFFVKIKIEK